MYPEGEVSLMAFSIYKVICVASLSHSRLPNYFIKAKIHEREKPLLAGYRRNEDTRLSISSNGHTEDAEICIATMTSQSKLQTT